MRDQGTLASQGIDGMGIYWSSTPSSPPMARHFFFSTNQSNVSAFMTTTRMRGLSVRCFRDTLPTTANNHQTTTNNNTNHTTTNNNQMMHMGEVVFYATVGDHQNPQGP